MSGTTKLSWALLDDMIAACDIEHGGQPTIEQSEAFLTGAALAIEVYTLALVREDGSRVHDLFERLSQMKRNGSDTAARVGEVVGERLTRLLEAS